MVPIRSSGLPGRPAPPHLAPGPWTEGSVQNIKIEASFGSPLETTTVGRPAERSRQSADKGTDLSRSPEELFLLHALLLRI